MVPPLSALAAALAALLWSQRADGAITGVSSVTYETASTVPASIVITVTNDASDSLAAGEALVLTPVTPATVFENTAMASGDVCTSIVDTASSPTDLQNAGAGFCRTNPSNELTITMGANVQPDATVATSYTVIATITAGLAAAPSTGGALSLTPTWRSTAGTNFVVYTVQTQLGVSVAPAVTLQSGSSSAITGITPYGIYFTFLPTTPMVTDLDTLTVTSPEGAIKAAPSPTPVPIPAPNCVVTQAAPAPAVTHTTQCSITDSNEFKVVFTNAGTVNVPNNGLVTVWLKPAGCPVAFEDHLTAGTSVTFDMATTTDASVLTGIAGWLTLAPSAGSDPIASRGGVARKFSLPPGRLVPLLVDPDISLHGATFEGQGPWEQWFGRMVIFSEHSDRWLKISIKKDILDVNRSQAAKNAFETLDVVAGYGDSDNPEPGASFPITSRDHNVPFGFIGAKVAFRVVHRHHKVPDVSIGRARRECAEIEGNSLHFFICSAPASEYFGWQRDLAIKFAHLDVAVHKISSSKADGLLPQLWGVRPLSEENARYLEDDDTSSKDVDQANASVKPLPESAGWAGGPTPEDLQVLVAAPADAAITV